MKILFYSMPGYGHTYPTLNVARELAKRGNKVIYYSIDEFKQRIEDAGLSYRDYGEKRFFDPILSRNISAFARKLLSLSSSEANSHIREAMREEPDCVIHDTLSFWGKIVASALHIPAVSLFTTFAINNAVAIAYPKMYLPIIANALAKGRDGIKAYALYLELCKRYHITPERTPDFILSKEGLNLVFTSSYFQPCANSFAKTFKFVGPSIYPRNERADLLKYLDRRKKVIYVSMGTIFNDNIQFYRKCITFFAQTDYQVIISLGHRLKIEDLPKAPENIIISNHIPQLEVLQKADLFITHAGMNSVSESIYYGVPMILIPQMYEQAFNANRVQELGAGIYIKQKNVTKDLLLNTIEKVIKTKSYYTNTQKIRSSLLAAGGYRKAADEIMDYFGQVLPYQQGSIAI